MKARSDRGVGIECLLAALGNGGHEDETDEQLIRRYAGGYAIVEFFEDMHRVRTFVVALENALSK